MSKSRNRRYYLLKLCKAWNKESGLELLDWLTELQEIAEDEGQDIKEWLSPNDIPSATLPHDADLTNVWSADKEGVVILRSNAQGFNISSVAALPKLGKLTTSRRSIMKEDKYEPRIAARIDKELKDAIEDYCWQNRIKLSDFLRIAVIRQLGLAEEGGDEEDNS